MEVVAKNGFKILPNGLFATRQEFTIYKIQMAEVNNVCGDLVHKAGNKIIPPKG